METKISIAKRKFIEGKKIESLKMVSKFKRLGKEKDIIRLAVDCLNNESFYKQLGKDTDKCVEDGIEAIKNKYEWS